MFRAARSKDRSEAAGAAPPLALRLSRALPETRRHEDAVVLAFPGAIKSAEPETMRSVRPRRQAPSLLVRKLHAFEAWCARLDLAPDLAEDIGSRRWLRGMATLLVLSGAAFACLPSYSAVEAATPMSLQAATRDEFRSQTIAPLAFGADTGRHMGSTSRMRPLNGMPERPSIELVSTLGQGDSLPAMLARAGLGGSDVDRVTALVGSVMATNTIAPGTTFDVTLGQRSAPGQSRQLQSLAFRARFDLDLAIERQSGGLSLVRRPIAVDAMPLRVRGTVGTSLYRSARNAGAPIGAIQAYLQAIDKYVSLDSEVTPGDEFDFVVSYRRSATGERQVGDLLYAGLVRAGKPRLQLVRWKDGAMAAATALEQPVPTSATLGMPVAGHVTSGYGMRRHPILGYARMHAGIDFGAPWGSPIYAVADGVVSFAGRHGGHGNYVRLEHGGGLGTGYGHMSRIAVGYGTRVHAGQVIGFVGSTGLSTGPHLHFEAYQGGHTIDPSGIRLAAARPQVDPHERDAFAARIRALLSIEPGAALAPIASRPVTAVNTAREIDRVAPPAAG